MYIIGSSSYVPDNIFNISDILNTSQINNKNQIVNYLKKNNFVEKRLFREDENIFEIAARVAESALLDAHLKAGEIDNIFFINNNPRLNASWIYSCIVAHQIGAVKAICQDINCGCASTMLSIKLAASLDERESVNNTLIIAVEKLSDYFFRDCSKKYKSIAAWGDGAGALVLSNNMPYDKMVYEIKNIQIKQIHSSALLIDLNNGNIDQGPFFSVPNYESFYFDQSDFAKIDSINMKSVFDVVYNCDKPEVIIASNTNTARLELLNKAPIVESFSKYGHMGAADIIINYHSYLNVDSKKNKVALVSWGSGYTWAVAELLSV